MADIFTAAQRHETMSRIRSRDTKPERLVRQSLFGRGYRFRVNVKTLPGTPDIVLPKYRTVIFVNGCFWHGHKGCKYYSVPDTNTEFWIEKVRRNKERDELNNQRLDSLSWSVITVWECELKAQRLDETIASIEAELKVNRDKWMAYREKRREDRAFARSEAKRKKALREVIERELSEQFQRPVKLADHSGLDATMLSKE